MNREESVSAAPALAGAGGGGEDAGTTRSPPSGYFEEQPTSDSKAWTHFRVMSETNPRGDNVDKHNVVCVHPVTGSVKRKHAAADGICGNTMIIPRSLLKSGEAGAYKMSDLNRHLRQAPKVISAGKQSAQAARQVAHAGITGDGGKILFSMLKAKSQTARTSTGAGSVVRRSPHAPPRAPHR